MRLRYTRPALADLDSILDYIALQSPQGANRVFARIQAIVGLLLTHPRIGVQTDDEVIRRITTTPYPYLIFYEISGDEIIIHAVRHAAGNPSDMPGAVI
jgi:plasmid stabilization system protein ParE